MAESHFAEGRKKPLDLIFLTKTCQIIKSGLTFIVSVPDFSSFTLVNITFHIPFKILSAYFRHLGLSRVLKH